jgi:hypothetical protein
MKKNILLGLGIAGLLLTACGSSGDKVVCTGSSEENGQKAEMKITANLKDGKVDTVDEELTFSDSTTATQYCGILEFANSFAESADQKIDFKCDGNTITIKGIQDQDEDSKKLSGMTKDEFIEYAKGQSDQITCK